MKLKFIIPLLLLPFCIVSQTNIPSKEWQVKTAVLGIAEEFREGAKVYGYDSHGNFMVLKKGTNQYVCLADDPNKEGFEIAAYHKDLDLFMARGRELKRQGKKFQEIFDIRENEVKNGSLKIPYCSTLIVLNGNVNQVTKEIENQHVRYVVYIPYATTETTGIPTVPHAAGHPWIMDPGTHRAHIMITPTYSETSED
ncbi:hypothetical protein [Snuella sedimenti]|uniref:Uncharacterized protein n=1 Tax=Snuella sedimenti TaxID=2798802 RepID=A0A8J7IP05_9FLAO|nr:hypothetical protein [Snuella sedimenti]MBJ6368247.1 hypothetical protein [Snuella sedimenti]